jgi:hypothetical protein
MIWMSATRERTNGLLQFINQQMQHIISYKTLLKHFKTLRHVSILSYHQGALFLAKVMLQYSYTVYCNITLARNKAPWWWSDKIETCRSVLKVFYVKLYVHSLVNEFKRFCKKCTVLQ